MYIKRVFGFSRKSIVDRKQIGFDVMIRTVRNKYSFLNFFLAACFEAKTAVYQTLKALQKF